MDSTLIYKINFNIPLPIKKKVGQQFQGGKLFRYEKEHEWHFFADMCDYISFVG